MPKKNDKSNSNLTSQNAKWQRESAKIRSVQISLDFPDAADVLLRTLAAREHKAPSSMIREIVGMPSSPPKRARIGVSFNDHELEELGKRYQIDPSDKAEIRRRLTEEVTSVLSSAEVLAADADNQPSKSQASAVSVSGTNVKQVNNTESELSGSSNTKRKAGKHLPLDSGALQELKSASDTIHQRFQQALAKRNSDDA